MNDKEKHNMLARFVYMHESTKMPVGRTEEEWDNIKLRIENKAHELARPILLEMVREYADREIACLDDICGHAKEKSEPQPALEHYYAQFRERASQKQEALEESCNALLQADWVDQAVERQKARQDSQFLKHVHAMKCALFIDIRDTFVSEMRARLVEKQGIRGTDYEHSFVDAVSALNNMLPHDGFYVMITEGGNLTLRLGLDDDYGLTVHIIEQALIRMFEEVHDG